MHWCQRNKEDQDQSSNVSSRVSDEQIVVECVAGTLDNRALNNRVTSSGTCTYQRERSLWRSSKVLHNAWCV